MSTSTKARTATSSSLASAGEGLSPEIYRELRAIAERRMARESNAMTLQPTALVHEAWLRMLNREQPCRDSRHFVAIAATTMRCILIDNARRRSRQRHGGDRLQLDAAVIDGIAAEESSDMLLLSDEAVTALEKTHPEYAQVLIGRFYGGLSNQELAASMDISERSVERYFAAAKVWLLRWLKRTHGI